MPPRYRRVRSAPQPRLAASMSALSMTVWEMSDLLPDLGAAFLAIASRPRPRSVRAKCRPAPSGGSMRSKRGRNEPDQAASARERALAARTARVMSGASPSAAIRTASAASVVPPGLGDVSPQGCGGVLRSGHQCAGAAHRLLRQLPGEGGGQPGGGTGLGQTFRKEKDISGTAAGDGRYRIHQRFRRRSRRRRRSLEAIARKIPFGPGRPRRWRMQRSCHGRWPRAYWAWRG